MTLVSFCLCLLLLSLFGVSAEELRRRRNSSPGRTSCCFSASMFYFCGDLKTALCLAVLALFGLSSPAHSPDISGLFHLAQNQPWNFHSEKVTSVCQLFMDQKRTGEKKRKEKKRKGWQKGLHPRRTAVGVVGLCSFSMSL